MMTYYSVHVPLTVLDIRKINAALEEIKPSLSDLYNKFRDLSLLDQETKYTPSELYYLWLREGSDLFLDLLNKDEVEVELTPHEFFCLERIMDGVFPEVHEKLIAAAQESPNPALRAAAQRYKEVTGDE